MYIIYIIYDVYYLYYLYYLYYMYDEIGIFFIFFNIQFVFDLYYKSYQLDFLKSVETEIDMNSFYLFNFFHFILLLLHIFEKHINIIFLEYPVKRYIYYEVFNKIKNMPKLWLEQNSATKIDFIMLSSQTAFYNKYNILFELYGSIIRVIMNTYILYTIYDKSLYLIMGYFIFYLLFYNYIILNTREKVKKNNIQINEINLVNKNLYLNYFNSCIGNFQDRYIYIINKNNNNINNYKLDNQIVNQFYLGTLQIFQKILMFIFIYFYIKTNCIKSCALFLLPLYQTTITLVYQFEYILHNYYGVINQDFSIYDNFTNTYYIEKYKNIINESKPLYITYNIDYKDKKTLIIDQKIDININDKILIQGSSGIGKSSLCKIMSGYFNNYIKKNSDNVLYITQNIYLTCENRTLYNVITENDLDLYKEDSKLFYYIIEKIIPFDDILNIFSDNFMFSVLENKSFSGGQEKRIYLAKWLYYLALHLDKYNILILDEPDKSLDANITNILLNNIINDPIFADLCIIVISHNIENIEMFDKTYIMEKKNNKLSLKLN